MIPKIIIDKQELRSHVSKHLDRMGAEMIFDTISVADYVLSHKVGVERKAADDFLKSWLDEKKIWSQITDLKNSYERPVLIIEGPDYEIYTARRVNPNAVRGILRWILVTMQVPIIWTRDAEDTATWLYRIADHEQDTKDKKAFSWHGKRSHLSSTELQEYIISAFPEVGPTNAKHLLEHFGSIYAIINAEKEDLMKVSKIGPMIASKIYDQSRGIYVPKTKSDTETKITGKSK